MIESLRLENFKSIKKVYIDCRRVNLFIGEPNTGKSNILESLGLLSHIYHGDIDRFVRMENIRNLFYDQDVDSSIIIRFDQKKLEIYYKANSFIGDYFDGQSRQNVFNYNINGHGSRTAISYFSQFKFYRFPMHTILSSDLYSEYLRTPDGRNIFAIIQNHKNLMEFSRQIFDKFGYRLMLEYPEYKIKVVKDLEYVMISIPYSLTSDTLQRLVFYMAAIYSNKNSILAFEEPESRAFPYYMKFLAERIAVDDTNQYFISTHNPYFLLSIIEKTRKKDLGVFVTYIENYETKIKMLSEKELGDILDHAIDPFFNIEKYINV